MFSLFKRLIDLYFDEEKYEILSIARCPICNGDAFFKYSPPNPNIDCDCDLEVIRNIDTYTKWLRYSE